MTDRPNIVLVTIDSLRADHCGFMGYEKDTTPTLDSMAEDGLVFENAKAPAPFTEESIPPMFTGDYPVRDTSNDASLGHAVRTHIDKHGSLVQALSSQRANSSWKRMLWPPKNRSPLLWNRIRLSAGPTRAPRAL